MRDHGLLLILAVALGLSGCGSETATMPNVVGKRLDAAKGAIKSAGIESAPEVDGGGVFGIVNDSSWTVCTQSPSPGSTVTSAPRLTVERSCPGTERQPTPAATAAPEAPERTVAKTTLTKSGSPQFASVLAVTDYCDPKVESFVSQNPDASVSFVGSIANLTKHGDTSTRYDILIAPGTKGPASTTGPAFKFEDVNILDLNLSGENVPDSIAEGDSFRFTAEIDEYDPKQCLLLLSPVSTKAL